MNSLHERGTFMAADVTECPPWLSSPTIGRSFLDDVAEMARNWAVLVFGRRPRQPLETQFRKSHFSCGDLPLALHGAKHD
jgi:hypothetical protein